MTGRSSAGPIDGVISLSIPIVAGVESRWVLELAARTADPAAEPGPLAGWLLLVMTCFAALLWTATVLSVVKPWGRTRWGRQELATRRRTTNLTRTHNKPVALDV